MDEEIPRRAHNLRPPNLEQPIRMKELAGLNQVEKKRGTIGNDVQIKQTRREQNQEKLSANNPSRRGMPVAYQCVLLTLRANALPRIPVMRATRQISPSSGSTGIEQTTGTAKSIPRTNSRQLSVTKERCSYPRKIIPNWQELPHTAVHNRHAKCCRDNPCHYSFRVHCKTLNKLRAILRKISPPSSSLA